ncbi:1-acyl-sn-glycerol-3-phosphate acyltransferase [Brevibacterium sp. 50QC2O2]|jgi:1-acyl-sn-glycerol-3-phosphate acyltransferase|uniref:lysophospholipid acyltransferase family protein n=1 Tax=Brevibacterium TaxID=1696 RepID=UPI00211D00A2|nr:MULTISPECIES: lysophospholipid acyltransferase family protein [unclassified Brevibacterium]MCQ9367806.1 1-acyl-sn-glycerol-3-phosphate acyltransferase [Brevibacterium sp. 91QC2O2]MCQ9384888.1 1-acyl-sn-glycerol-3-phosphate acyltransferase [Brevibacterium sp. 68QC2CO]MCQ9388065.1 1-acyl-sn-glycerol-3-phosphate acyltransferase [Brevibacterium sp. 50QC2O2]
MSKDAAARAAKEQRKRAHEEEVVAGIDYSPKLLARSRSVAHVVAPPLTALFRTMGKPHSHGFENVGDSGAVIVAGLHLSKVDPVLLSLDLWHHGRMPHFLAKASLFTGFLGVFMRPLAQIPVLRGSAGAAESLVSAKKALAAGEVVVIFPRGTLTADPDGWPDPSRTGAARLAIETGTPVVPAAHWGLQDTMTKHNKAVKPQFGRRMDLVYGERIDPAPYAGVPDGISRLTHEITYQTAALLARLRGVELPARFTTDHRLADEDRADG